MFIYLFMYLIIYLLISFLFICFAFRFTALNNVLCMLNVQIFPLYCKPTIFPVSIISPFKITTMENGVGLKLNYKALTVNYVNYSHSLLIKIITIKYLW